MRARLFALVLVCTSWAMAFSVAAEEAPAAAVAGPKRIGELGKALRQLQVWLNKHDRAVARSLRRPASRAERAKLAQAVFNTRQLPPELDTWFAWHNGQTDAGEIDVNIAGRLMSARESLEAWERNREMQKQGELMEPWSLSWVPILTKYDGSLLVWDAGAVRWWWHDSTDRDVLSESLAAFANAIVVGRKHEALRATQKLRRPESLDLETTESISNLTLEQTRQAKTGTSFSAYLDGSEILCLKMGLDLWACGYSDQSVEAAFEKVRQKVTTPRDGWEDRDSAVHSRLHHSHVTRAQVKLGRPLTLSKD